MEQSVAELEVGCLVEARQDVAESRMNYLSVSVGNLLELLYIGDEIDDCGEWIYARSISSGRQGWLLRQTVKLHVFGGSCSTVGEVMIAREKVVAHSLGYLALDRGDAVCVLYVGTTMSKDAGWLFGECLQDTPDRGWLPAAMLYPSKPVVLEIVALSGEAVAIVELQPSDALDTLPLVVSKATGDDTIYEFFHGSHLLAGPRAIVDTDLVSGSQICAVRTMMPHFVTVERSSSDMVVVKRWACSDWKHQTICEVGGSVQLLQTSRDGQIVVVIFQAHAGIANIFHAGQNHCVATFPEHAGGIAYTCISNCHSLVVTLSRAGTARTWQATTGQCISTLAWDGFQSWGCCAAVLPSCQCVALASTLDGGTTALWDIESNRILSSFNGWTGKPLWAIVAAFSDDASLVAMDSCGGRVEVRDFWTSEVKGSANEGEHSHGTDLCAVAFSPNNQMLATSSRDTTVKLWTMDGSCVLTLTTQDEIECIKMQIAFSYNGRVVVGVQGWDCQEEEGISGDGLPCSVHLWDTSSGMCLRRLCWQSVCIDCRVGASSPPLMY